MAKVNHACIVEQVVRTKSLPELEDRRRTSQDASFRVLKEIVRGWIGRDSILLKAEQLSSGAGYGWTAGKNTLNGKPSAYVEEYKDLGYPNDDG